MRDLPGYDLTGVIVGSEGTLCVVTKVIVRLLPVPETGYTLVAQFKAVEDAANAVSQMIASGIVPAVHGSHPVRRHRPHASPPAPTPKSPPA